MGNFHVNCRGTLDNSFKTQELTPIMGRVLRSTLNVTKSLNISNLPSCSFQDFAIRRFELLAELTH